MPEEDASAAGAGRPRGRDVVETRDAPGFGARQPRVRHPPGGSERDDGVRRRGAEHRGERDREEEARKSENDVHETSHRSVQPSTLFSGQEPEQRSEDG